MTSQKAARRASRPERIDENQLYSIPETASALDTSRVGVYDLIKRGKITPVNIDSRMRVPGREIIRISSGA